MVSILDLIGGASGIATLLDFLIPDGTAAERGNTLVTVQVGLNGIQGDDGPLEGADGNYPWIQLANSVDEVIASTIEADLLFTQIGSGSFATLEHGPTNGQQSTQFYLEPVIGDQICVASVTVTWPDQQRRAWIGDNGAACEASWYPSGIIVDESNYETRCTWVNPEAGPDAEDQHLSNAFAVDFRRFNGVDPSVPEEADALSNQDFWDQWCHFPPAQQFANGLVDHPWDRRRSLPNMGPFKSYSGDIKKRNAATHPHGPAKKRSPSLVGRNQKETRLVVSNSNRFSAKDVCSSPGSWGPDYVSLEDGFFCDMATKTLKPLCADDVDEECFQLEEASGTKHKRAIADRSKYSKIVEMNPLNQTMSY